jgi:cytochrome c-type biogenesis protein
MTLIIISFVAGLLSVLAPCVLPVIPVIFGGSLSGNTGSKAWRIILSMMISILLFTLLLKVSSLFLNIDPAVWTWISGVIIGLYGLVLIWPQLRERFSMTLKLDRINAVADGASAKGGLRGDILLGASLGPIFSTCSPTYVLLFSTVLPINFGLALICMIVYVLGFGGFLALLVK